MKRVKTVIIKFIDRETSRRQFTKLIQ